MRLQDRTVLVTGGGSGIGRATAERCAESGATVVAADLDLDAAEETTAAIDGTDGAAIARQVDVRDAEAVSGLVGAVADEHGLDVVVNNAGISHPRGNLEDLDAEEFDRVLDVNVRGVWNGCRAALPVLKEQGSGAIVNTASLAGVIGAPGLSIYSLSKGAIVNFTRTVAAEAGPHGVRANAVCPGVVETPLPKRSVETEDEWREIADRMAENYPLGRLGQPEDVANCIRFLASDEAAWVTGHALVVDGGFSCA